MEYVSNTSADLIHRKMGMDSLGHSYNEMSACKNTMPWELVFLSSSCI